MYRLWLTVFGSGYCPLAPGTCGSAVTALAFFLTASLTRSPAATFVITAAIAIHGMIVTLLYGNRFIQKYGPDPHQLVSDEQAGQALTLLWLWPLAQYSLAHIIVLTLTGFILFRVFDILKPPPVRQLEKIPGPWGILLDDIMAGIYGLLSLQILSHLGWLDIF